MRHLLAVILVITTFTTAFSQTKGSLLIFSSQSGVLFIDGDTKGSVKEGIPKKVELNSGEYYVQVVNDSIGYNIGKSVKVEANQRQVLKLGESNKLKKPKEILVADINFLAPGITSAIADLGNSKTFYYAFDEGDSVIIDLRMSNKKGTNSIVVYSYPDMVSKYKNMSFKELSHLKFRVDRKSILAFQISSNHIFDRTCFFKVFRKPRSGGNFSYSTEVKKVKEYKVETVLSRQHIYLNGYLAINGKTRVALPIKLPPGTEKWYYTVAASTDKQVIQEDIEKFDLARQLTNLLGKSGGILSFTIEQIVKPKGTDRVDVYLIDYSNHSLFLSKKQFSYLISGTRENISSAAVDLGVYNQVMYLGLGNNTNAGVDVFIEAVALVPTTKYLRVE